MNNKEILNRLESIGIDLLQKVKESYSEEIRLENEKDLNALNKTIELLKENENIFDVAKWSKLDILDVMENINITPKGDDQEIFVESVIDLLNERFDASIGVNWGLIEDAIYDVNENFLRGK